jgi:hypothetical protein
MQPSPTSNNLSTDINASISELPRLVNTLISVLDKKAAAPIPNSSGPVPVTKPETPNLTQPSSIITIDPESLKGLTQFNTNFATYVDKLLNHTFPPVEHKLEVNVAPVQVQITGAAAFESLEKRMREVAETLVNSGISQLEKEIVRSINPPGFKTADTRGKKNTP